MLLTPPPLRSTVSEQPDGLRISIPAPRNLFIAIFFLFWGIIWTCGGISVIHQTFVENRGGLFELAWLGIWAIALVFVSYSWLWNLFGVDAVTVRGCEIHLRSSIFGIGRKRAYLASDIHNLRFIPEMGAGKSHRESNIAFDFGAKTIKFAGGIEEAEANQLVILVRSRATISDLPSFSDYRSSARRGWN